MLKISDDSPLPFRGNQPTKICEILAKSSQFAVKFVKVLTNIANEKFAKLGLPERCHPPAGWGKPNFQIRFIWNGIGRDCGGRPLLSLRTA